MHSRASGFIVLAFAVALANAQMDRDIQAAQQFQQCARPSRALENGIPDQGLLPEI
jgi:hypothetical protein